MSNTISQLITLATIMEQTGNDTNVFSPVKLRIFLTIALCKKATAKQLIGMTGVPFGSMNRHLQALRPIKITKPRRKIGLGLIESRSVQDNLKEHYFVLTLKGKEVLRSFTELKLSSSAGKENVNADSTDVTGETKKRGWHRVKKSTKREEG